MKIKIKIYFISFKKSTRHKFYYLFRNFQKYYSFTSNGIISIGDVAFVAERESDTIFGQVGEER